MSFHWIDNDRFVYDNVILRKKNDGEWGAEDAINEYEAEKARKERAQRSKTKALIREVVEDVVDERLAKIEEEIKELSRDVHPQL